jgi:hypothetical protein
MGISKGYNYITGRFSLDCDKCGNLNASRIKCPIKWCYPVQLCADCAKATGWRKKANHANCYAEQEKNEAERLHFLQENANKWVAVSAFGSWAEWVPNGMVGVCAYRGGNAGGRTGEATYWIVPADEYAQRQDQGFVIDEMRHYRFDNDPTQLRTKEVSVV